MPSEPTRRTLLAACGALTASLAGCLSDVGVSGRFGDAEVANVSDAAGDANSSTSRTTETARPAHCMAVAIDSYLDPRNDQSGRETLVVEVDLDASNPPRLSGEIVSCEGTTSVSKRLSDGGDRFEFGPYDDGCLERHEFWLEGCRSGSKADD